ncbi:hypothetical protein DOTSEDRAFT_36216 [Dothistroma septosporum NZE10]|uniref:Uncharacterized protein n=1 Tax=Dothistroma septosporum (strain NZE10 / CBS 128990) TaxID=675120 RepID=N1PL98_DOTSN|nr:hypothetical protein DOTSEDRAFT_36216 [Dothistroma septosporum NZE10]
MMYSRCTDDELRQFVKDRRLAVKIARPDSATPNREDYIEALKRADNHLTKPFSFFEIPAELRNRVYELLVDDESLASAYPRLLGSSGQIYDEASNMLYSSNAVTMKIGSSIVHVNGRRVRNHSSRSIATLYMKWPAVLKKVAHFRIAFTGTWQSQLTGGVTPSLQSSWKNKHRERASAVNQVLFSLALFLLPKNNLKNVTLDLASMLGKAPDLRPYEKCTCIESAFRPLRFFPQLAGNHIELDRMAHAEFTELIESLWSEPTWLPSHNVPLHDLSPIMLKAEACHRLCSKLDLYDEEGDNRWKFMGSNSWVDRELTTGGIERRLSEAKSRLNPGKSVSRENEAPLLLAIAAPKGHIEKLDIDGIRAQAGESAMAMMKRDLDKMENVIKALE